MSVRAGVNDLFEFSPALFKECSAPYCSRNASSIPQAQLPNRKARPNILVKDVQAAALQRDYGPYGYFVISMP